MFSKSGCGNLPLLIHDCCGPANGPAEQWTGERLSQGRQAAVVAWKPCTLQSTLGFGPKPRVWQVSLRLLMRSWLPRLRSFLYLWRRHLNLFPSQWIQEVPSTILKELPKMICHNRSLATSKTLEKWNPIKIRKKKRFCPFGGYITSPFTLEARGSTSSPGRHTEGSCGLEMGEPNGRPSNLEDKDAVEVIVLWLFNRAMENCPFKDDKHW